MGGHGVRYATGKRNSPIPRKASISIAYPASQHVRPGTEHANTNPMLTDRDSLLRKLHELRSEHRDLDTVIARLSDGGIDQLQLQRLKKRKLLLKDEVAWLESRLIPDSIA